MRVAFPRQSICSVISFDSAGMEAYCLKILNTSDLPRRKPPLMMVAFPASLYIICPAISFDSAGIGLVRVSRSSTLGGPKTTKGSNYIALSKERRAGQPTGRGATGEIRSSQSLPLLHHPHHTVRGSVTGAWKQKKGETIQPHSFPNQLQRVVFPPFCRVCWAGTILSP